MSAAQATWIEPGIIDDDRIAGEGWVTVSVLSEVLSVKQPTIRSWIRRGQAPPHYKLGSLVRFRKPDVRVWISDRYSPS